MKNSRSGQTNILMASVTLNVALIAIAFWLSIHDANILNNAYAEAARSRAQLQQSILNALESNDPQQVELLKSQLQIGIDVDLRVAYKIETGAVPEKK